MAFEDCSDGITAKVLVQEMVAESIGLDSPMTPGALAVASVEVGARLDSAMAALNPDGEDLPHDTKAMMALYLMSRD